MPPEDVAIAIFNESLHAILDEIRLIRAGKQDTSPHQPVTRIAWLAQRASSVQGELRKANAAREKGANAVNKPTVLAWARKLEQAERVQLVRELQDLDARRSVL
jgi:hypothetical protein